MPERGSAGIYRGDAAVSHDPAAALTPLIGAPGAGTSSGRGTEANQASSSALTQATRLADTTAAREQPFALQHQQLLRVLKSMPYSVAKLFKRDEFRATFFD